MDDAKTAWEIVSLLIEVAGIDPPVKLDGGWEISFAYDEYSGLVPEDKEYLIEALQTYWRNRKDPLGA